MISRISLAQPSEHFIVWPSILSDLWWYVVRKIRSLTKPLQDNKTNIQKHKKIINEKKDFYYKSQWNAGHLWRRLPLLTYMICLHDIERTSFFPFQVRSWLTGAQKQHKEKVIRLESECQKTPGLALSGCVGAVCPEGHLAAAWKEQGWWKMTLAFYLS